MGGAVGDLSRSMSYYMIWGNEKWVSGLPAPCPGCKLPGGSRIADGSLPGTAGRTEQQSGLSAERVAKGNQ